MFSYTKLRDGDWGLRYRGAEQFEPGTKVTVHTKGGAIKSEVVGKKIWSGADQDGGPVSLYAIQGKEKPAEPKKQDDPPVWNDDDADRWDDFG